MNKNKFFLSFFLSYLIIIPIFSQPQETNKGIIYKSSQTSQEEVPELLSSEKKVKPSENKLNKKKIPWFLRWIKGSKERKKKLSKKKSELKVKDIIKENKSLKEQLAQNLEEFQEAKLEIERLRKKLNSLKYFVVASGLLTEKQLKELEKGDWEETLEKLIKTKGLLNRTDFHEVKKGECLWIIARKEYGNPYKWLLLYHANKDQIYDPDLIYPGMILIVPRY